MKNAVKFVGIIAFAAVIGFLFTACNDGNPKPCIAHDWDWTLDSIEATCTVKSKDTATCKNVGCTATNQRDGSMDALGHEGSISAFAATCTTDGNSELSGTCTRIGCDHVVVGIVIYAIGHEGVNAVTATCTEDGNEGIGSCTRAGCDHVAVGTVIPALEHEGLIPAFDATCTTAGNSEA